MKVTKKNILAVFKKLVSSVWFFPPILLMIFFTLVTLGINGSSIGIYNEVLNKTSTGDSSLLLGKPRAIRSDEWIVITQMVISQKEEGYPATNMNIANGQDMNVALDVPPKDWSQLFRPQNHAFFVLPFDNAFAYRWWFFAVVLMLAVYFFTLTLLPGRRLIASLLALSVYFSGFVQWWYQSTTLGTLTYAILIAFLIIKLFEATSVRKRVFLSLALIYAFACFAIILYPPFQIPCALVVASFVIGYAFHIYRPKQLWRVLKSLSPYIVSIVVATIAIIGLYIYQNQGAIDALRNTSYPGKRIVESGGYSPTHLLSGSVATQFLDYSTAQFYTAEPNQSEASTFIFLSFFLAPPLLYMMLKKIDSEEKLRKNTLSDFAPGLLAGLAVPLTLLLAWLFLPGLALIGKVTLLNMVPVNRLIIGLGLLNLFAVIVFIVIYSKKQHTLSRTTALVFSLIAFSVCAFVNLQIVSQSPGFINIGLALLFALPVPAATYLILRKKFSYGLAILAVFSVIGTALVNPLYLGMGKSVDNPVIAAVREYP
ncbi:MAG TPA: hypothetical protein PKD68_00200 [Candidatus Saccharibacteria bacterium]|nr:hypothetical protein [Candidatus Saccharibacteria bacterium]